MSLSPLTTGHYLALSAALLLLCALGLLLRRNVIVMLMSVELILNAVNLNLIAFSQHWRHTTGQIFAIFVICVAVAEAAIALGILIALFRNRGTLLSDEIDLLKW
ncbi:MAG: NADH-quinone oxidoreductase subunit NuoK [Acidobacteriota bacterium]